MDPKHRLPPPAVMPRSEPARVPVPPVRWPEPRTAVQRKVEPGPQIAQPSRMQPAAPPVHWPHPPQALQPQVAPPPLPAPQRPAVAKTAAPPSPAIQMSGRPQRKVKRKSPDEKRKDRFTHQALKSSDKRGRTRGAKKALKNLETQLGKQNLRLTDLQPLLSEGPPHRLALTGENIYSGKWRSFSTKFQKEWWAKQGTSWTCHICEGPIDPKGQGSYKPSIDHIEPWSQSKLAITTFRVCKNGQHWEVAFTDEVRAVLEDPDNLLPAHQGCNSAKGGRTDTDSLAPQRRGTCPGENCTAIKAE